jgi:hypothetical protein
MSGQGKNEARRRFNLAVACLALLAILLFAGCGSSGDDSATATSQKEAGCQVGKSVLPLIPQAPDWWKEGLGPTLALACLHDSVVGDAILVGYSSPESTGGRCVNAYNLTLAWSPGEKCAAPGVEWSHWCKAPGCVWAMAHDGDVTGLAGMLEPTVKKIKILVRGKPLKRGVMVAQVRGKTVREIGSQSPFGFFAAFIHGCVQPKEVKVELMGVEGSRLGYAPVYPSHENCPRPS